MKPLAPETIDDRVCRLVRRMGGHWPIGYRECKEERDRLFELEVNVSRSAYDDEGER